VTVNDRGPIGDAIARTERSVIVQGVHPFACLLQDDVVCVDRINRERLLTGDENRRENDQPFVHGIDTLLFAMFVRVDVRNRFALPCHGLAAAKLPTWKKRPVQKLYVTPMVTRFR
jgi:hypothetical protein